MTATPLGDGIARISGELAALRSEVRLAHRSWRATIAVVVVAIAVGAVLFYNDHRQDVRREQDARQYDLDQCERGNTSRAAIGEAFDKQRDALVGASAASASTRSPQQQQALERYNADIDALIAEFAPRDCDALVNGT